MAASTDLTGRDGQAYRATYVCPCCANRIPADQVDERLSGSKGDVIVRRQPTCACHGGSPRFMRRVVHRISKAEAS